VPPLFTSISHYSRALFSLIDVASQVMKFFLPVLLIMTTTFKKIGSLVLQIAPKLSRKSSNVLPNSRTRLSLSSNRILSNSHSSSYSSRLLSTSESQNIETETTDYYSIDSSDQNIAYGDFSIIASQSETGRKFVEFEDLGKENGPKEGDIVWIRGRVSSVRAKGNACFMVLRSGSFNTVQACHFKDKENPEISKKLIKYTGSLPLESIVDIMGVVVAADVKSCSVSNVELQIRRIYTISRAPVVLPFLLEDASRPQADIDASEGTERPFAAVLQNTRLDNRWLDLRVPSNNAIMRVRSGVSLLFREALHAEGFIEINTPKLIAGESEGGSDVFRTDYFGQPACLAQSPQLYKQMAISADMERVYEIGPVFRAENSNTRRHLCEFTGLDMEMAIKEHYNEALVVLHRMFRHIFDGLEERYPKELAVIRLQYPSEPVKFTAEPLILHWGEGMSMLKEAGNEVDELADLSSALELTLGQV
jgi:aspartyl/asparaginyl-tRNA synthetase